MIIFSADYRDVLMVIILYNYHDVMVTIEKYTVSFVQLCVCCFHFLFSKFVCNFVGLPNPCVREAWHGKTPPLERFLKNYLFWYCLASLRHDPIKIIQNRRKLGTNQGKLGKLTKMR